MSTETQEKYKPVIADLKARRARLDVTIATLEQIATGTFDNVASLDETLNSAGSDAGESRADQQATPTEIRSDTFFGLSIPDAIRKCFRIMKRPMSLSEITGSLKSGGLLTTATNLMPTISATLQRMKKQSELVSPNPGKWAPIEWYTGLRKEKIEATTKPKKRSRSKAKKPHKVSTPKAATGATNSDSPKSQLIWKPTTEQIAQVLALHATGKKPAEIEKETGVAALFVGRLVAKAKREAGAKAS